MRVRPISEDEIIGASKPIAYAVDGKVRVVICVVLIILVFIYFYSTGKMAAVSLCWGYIEAASSPLIPRTRWFRFHSQFLDCY